MRIGLLQEGHTTPGQGADARYHEIVEEAMLAEASGFDFYCLPEQHFIEDVATVSAPEILFSFIAARTTTLRLRFTSLVLLSYNHPVRMAERIASLDILSGGRMEVGTARSNNIWTLDAFGVDPSTTRAQWEESMELLLKALSQETVEHDGSLWSMPPRLMQPRPVQRPHPPVYVSATSLETHRRAGRLGLAVMNGNNILGWDYLQGCLDEYRAGLAEAQAAGEAPTNPSAAVTIVAANVHDDPELAMEQAAPSAYAFVDIVLSMYSRLSEAASDYAYLGQIRSIAEHSRDLPFLVGLAPYISIGTPEFLLDRFRRLEAMGADEIILRVDGMGHELNCQAIEAIGTRVIAPLREGGLDAAA